VRIVIIVISRLRKKDGNFIDEFHARNSRTKLGKVTLRERRLENKREERRNE